MKGERLIEATGEEDFPYRIAQTNGAYGKYGKEWYCTTPNGCFGVLGGHYVVEHDDGTITVSPSILITGGGDGKSYHGYIERGVWRSC